MLRIRKGDMVAVLAGKDRGKQAKVIRVFPSINKALVEGINYVKKHKRRTQQDQQHAGIVSVEQPIAVSNLMVVCKNCGKPVRTTFVVQKDNTKARLCKKCNEVV